MKLTPEARQAVVSPAVDEYRRAVKGGETGSHRFASLVGLPSQDPLELARRVARGLAFTALERFQRNSGLSMGDVAELVEIAPSTLHRRKKDRRLDPQESDRLLRASRVFGKALELFEGDAEAARQWLAAPQRALGDERPLVLARTDVGAREVEALVDRLEQGILA